MINPEKWQSLKDRLADAEKRRDYEHCAMLALALSDECESIEAAQAWVTQGQVYATLSVTRQMQLRAESVMGA